MHSTKVFSVTKKSDLIFYFSLDGNYQVLYAGQGLLIDQMQLQYIGIIIRYPISPLTSGQYITRYQMNKYFYTVKNSTLISQHLIINL